MTADLSVGWLRTGRMGAAVRTEAARRDIGFLSAPISGNPDIEGSASIVAAGLPRDDHQP